MEAGDLGDAGVGELVGAEVERGEIFHAGKGADGDVGELAIRQGELADLVEPGDLGGGLAVEQAAGEG